MFLTLINNVCSLQNLKKNEIKVKVWYICILSINSFNLRYTSDQIISSIKLKQHTQYWMADIYTRL